MSEKEFVDGLIVKAPKDGAPEFVKCAISIKRKDLGNWLRSKSDDWINIDVKVSQNGKWYAEVNNWKPSQDQMNQVKQATQGTQQGPQSNQAAQVQGGAEFWDDDIPFMRPHDEYFG